MAVLLRVPEVDDPDFVADVTYADGAVLRLAGSADRSATEPLARLLARVHAELGRQGAKAIVVDLTELDFMAAPCFRQLLAWVNKVQELEASRRYQLRLRGNRALPWQVHSLAALSCFDTELVSIEA